MAGSIRTRSSTVALALLTASLFWTPSAFADAIDGDWCLGSQTLNIQGPRIRTPGGTDMTGNYGRHDFNYVVPASEPGAGAEIDMQLMGHELMILRRKVGATVSEPENWRRCRPTS